MSEKPPVIPSSESPKAPTMTTLLAEYGSIKSIPDELLDSVGYQRIADGRVIRKGVEVAKSAHEKKLEKAPFQRFSLELIKTKKGRGVYDSKDHEKLLKLLKVGNKWDLGSANILAAPLDEELLSAIERMDDDEDYDTYLIERGIDASPSGIIEDLYVLREEDPNGKIAEMLSELYQENSLAVESATAQGLQEDNQITVKMCENMAEIIGRFQAKYGDKDHFQADDERSLDSVCDFADKEIAKDSLFEVQKFIISEALKDMGHEALAGHLELAKTRQELDAMVLPAEEAAEMARQKQLLKSATIEEKKQISRNFKEIKLARKRDAQLLTGIQSFFCPWEVKSQKIRQVTQKAIDFLIHGSDEAETVKLDFIGTPDPVLDTDPGVISGDCTAGNPLPFKNADNTLFNIKILHDNIHLGNIYLLDDIISDEFEDIFGNRGLVGSTIWYLDAIQLSMILDWEQAFEKLINRLALEADKKGVQFIAFSQEEHLISNYSAISRAAKNYAEKEQLEIEEFSLKQEEKARIQFEGEAYLLEVKKLMLSQNPFIK